MSIENKEMLEDEAQTDILGSVMSDEGGEETTQTETTEQPEAEPKAAKPRDEATGRFKPKGDEQLEETEQQEQPQEQARRGNIPSSRLKEEAEKKRAAEERATTAEERARQLETRLALLERNALQPTQRPQPIEAPKPQELPDPLLDPVGYQTALRDQITAEVKIERFNDSMETAADTHGETFSKAFAEANQLINSGDQSVRAMLMNARNPGKALMTWYREREASREVGGDPKAYFEKQLEAWLNDPANQAAVIERVKSGKSNSQAQRPGTKIDLPPSLNNSANAASRAGEDGDIDEPDTQRAIMTSLFR